MNDLIFTVVVRWISTCSAGETTTTCWYQSL